MKIHKIELPTPFPVGNVNVWFIENSEPVLVDAGVRSSKSFEALSFGLERLGYQVKDIRRILLTHYHLDHAGGAAELAGICDAELYLSPRCNYQLSNVNTHRDCYRDYLERCGVPSEILNLFRESNLRWLRFGSDWSKVRRIQLVQDGDLIELDDLRLECLHTPGHSQDHVCFADQERRFVFSGDHLLAGITPNPLIYFDPENGMSRSRSLLNYLDSLSKLERLEASAAFGGHGPDMEAPQSVIDKNRRLVDLRCRSFLTLIRKFEKISVYELALKHFGKLHPLEVYLAVSETIAYMDLLLLQGMVSFDEDAPLLQVSAI